MAGARNFVLYYKDTGQIAFQTTGSLAEFFQRFQESGISPDSVVDAWGVPLSDGNPGSSKLKDTLAALSYELTQAAAKIHELQARVQSREDSLVAIEKTLRDIPLVVWKALEARSARRNAYGAALKNFEDIAALNSAVLRREVTPLEVCLLLDNVKTSRLLHTPDHEDSIVDKIGYMLVYAKIIEEQQARENVRVNLRAVKSND